jgi:hypothetical protein
MENLYCASRARFQPKNLSRKKFLLSNFTSQSKLVTVQQETCIKIPNRSHMENAMLSRIQERINAEFPDAFFALDIPDLRERGFWWLDIIRTKRWIAVAWSEVYRKIGINLIDPNEPFQGFPPEGVTPGDKVFDEDKFEDAIIYIKDGILNGPTHS